MRPILLFIAHAGCLAAAGCSAPPAFSGTSSEFGSLHAFLQRELDDEPHDLQEPQYAAALVDLDADGRDEAVVYVQSWRSCGTGGCGFYVLARSGAGWRIVAETSLGWPPVRVLETRSNGWRDLGILVRGGGILPGYEALLAFDGRTYPYNPSVPPARPLRPGAPGRVLIPREPQFRPLLD